MWYVCWRELVGITTGEKMEEQKKPVIGYKLLDGDQSLTSEYGRVRYPVGEWVTVPGNGAYVAVSGGLLSGGGDVARHQLAVFECEESVAVADVSAGVVCFRRVRRLVLDQALLARIAENDLDWGVRLAAVARVEDQTLLARVAEHAADWQVGRMTHRPSSQARPEPRPK